MTTLVKTYTAKSDVPLEHLVACLQANSVVRVHHLRTVFPLSLLLRSSRIYMRVRGDTVRLIECPPKERNVFLFFGRGCSVIEIRKATERLYTARRYKDYILAASQTVIGRLLTLILIAIVVGCLSILASLLYTQQINLARATVLVIGAVFMMAMAWIVYLLFARAVRWLDRRFRNDQERWFGLVKHCLGDVPLDAEERADIAPTSPPPPARP